MLDHGDQGSSENDYKGYDLGGLHSHGRQSERPTAARSAATTVTYDGSLAHRQRHLQGRRRHDRAGRARQVGHDPHQRRRLPERPSGRLPTPAATTTTPRAPSTTRSTRRTPTAARSAATTVTYDGSLAHRQRHLQGRRRHDRAGRARQVGHDPHQRRRLPERPLDVYRLQRQLQRHLRAPSTTRSTRRTPTAARSAATTVTYDGSLAHRQRHLQGRRRHDCAGRARQVGHDPHQRRATT